MNIVEGPAEVTKMIKNCISQEMTDEGLLSEVESFIPSYRMDEEMEEPLIWLFEHETISADGKSGKLSNKLLLSTPYEFVCVVYDEEDIEKSEEKGKQLACRVAATIAKHLSRVNEDGKQVLNALKFEALYPVGTVIVKGKSNKAPATSLRLIVEFYVDWSICCRKNFKSKNNGD